MSVQEKALKQKQDAKKPHQPLASNSDTATSSHTAAAAGATHGADPGGAVPSSPAALEAEASDSSPFACVSAIMGWETFHMVHVLWIGLVDLPGKAPEKDWDLQVSLTLHCRHTQPCHASGLSLSIVGILHVVVIWLRC